jgi:hypothetical protein
MSSVDVTSAVTGGGEAATFVLVGPPPHAVSAIANSTNIDKSTLPFLILSYSFSYRKMRSCQKKYAPLMEHRL